MATEQTLIIVKPDAVTRSLVKPVKDRIAKEGLTIVSYDVVVATKEQAEAHYVDQKDTGHYEKLIEYTCSGPIFIAVVEGENAVQKLRDASGPTNPEDAKKEAPDSIRAKHGKDIMKNVLHSSDSVDNARKEIAIWKL